MLSKSGADRTGVRPSAVVALMATVIAAVAAVVELANPAHLVNAGGRAGIETFISLAAGASAAFLLARPAATRRRRDMLLVAALISSALTDFAFQGLPALTGWAPPAEAMGASTACRVFVAIALAGVAFAPAARSVRSWRASVILLAGIGTAVVVLANRPSDRVGLAALSSGLLIAGGIWFALRALRGEQDVGMLAAASLLLGASRLEALAVPTVGIDWITVGDGARVGAWIAMLAFAAQRCATVQREATQAALAAERERIARDLHDGLAQELAFIATTGQGLHSDDDVHPITAAARRALALSRSAIADLSAAAAPTTEVALRQVAGELAERFQVRVDVVVDAGGSDAELSAADREEVVRIAREAIVNAARHGGADRVEVLLNRGRSTAPLLRISDNGSGIDDTAQHHPFGGFGLPTMRARAKALGGQLRTSNGPHGGTELEVLVS